MNSLQNQYNLLKEGKLAKDVFLKHAKLLFPEYIPNSMGFDPAVNILKQRSILKEDSSYREVVKEKDNFEADFKKFLFEAKKEEKSIKADLKKADKSVDNTNDAANYDNTDTKSADNVIFDQYMRGIYVEMSKDSKQDLETVKKKVLKNLTKDPIFYVKNGQFGVEGVGYSDELPGAKTATDDQMIIIDKSKPKTNVKDTLGKKEAAKGAPAKVKEMSTTAKNSKGVKKMAPPTKGKIIKLKENQSLEELMNEADTEDNDYPKYKAEVAKMTDPKIQKAWVDLYGGEIDGKGLVDIIKKVCTGFDDGFYEFIESFSNLNTDKLPPISSSGSPVYGFYDFDIEDSLDMTREEFKELYDKMEAAYKNVVNGSPSKIDEGVEAMDDTKFIEKLAKELCADKEFADGTGYLNQPQKLMAKYSAEDIKEFYKEIFGDLPLGDPSAFSANEGLNERLKGIIGKVLEGGMEDADAQLAKQEADAEAKAAAVSKQRADNKAKIAAANKNI